MTRPRIVLYNPKSVFYTMPLALVAVASALDRRRYDVRIVDARLDADAIGTLLEDTAGALCLGVTVLTGEPIRDALRATRAVRARHPALPIVWGGWHPSLFPADTLVEPAIDIVVTGQGEETFAEIVDRLDAGAPADAVAGTAVRSGDRVVVNPPRPMRDIGCFPSHDYDLIPVSKYFALKGQRQLDYISSQGCRFRCTFCADPYVYNRSWFGLDPARVGDELDQLWRRHRFDDVGFQDETFFTSRTRVEAMAEAFLRRGVRFTWYATLRADQAFRLDEASLAACRRAGLRRVIVGVESGSQRMLDWMKKDLRLEHVFDSADKCRRVGVGVLFNFIVGFPDEPDESVEETLRVARELTSLSPDFEVAIFYYKPYPGNDIADMLRTRGHRFPRTLDEWAGFDYVGSSSPWVGDGTRRRVERFKFYQRIGWSRPTPWRAPIQALARWRCKTDRFAFPIEKTIAEWVRPPVRLS